MVLRAVVAVLGKGEPLASSSAEPPPAWSRLFAAAWRRPPTTDRSTSVVFGAASSMCEVTSGPSYRRVTKWIPVCVLASRSRPAEVTPIWNRCVPGDSCANSIPVVPMPVFDVPGANRAGSRSVSKSTRVRPSGVTA